MSRAETNTPPKPRKLSVHVEHTAEGLLLSRRNREWVAGVFLLLWLIGWTAGSVFLARLVIDDPSLMHLLIAIALWGVWFVVIFLVLKMFFQLDRLLLSGDGISFDRHIIVRVQQRFVPLEEIQHFDIYSRVTDAETGHQEWGIEMVTLGTPIQLFSGIPEQDREWLQYLLNDMLSKLRGETSAPSVTSQAAVELDESATLQSEAGETLVVAEQPLRPPTDCEWQRIEEIGAITFLQRGKFSWVGLFGCLFINAFWNGIVSVFVMQLIGGPQQPQGFEWWQLFVFLIPFEAIGLCMIVLLILTLIEPFRRFTWRFQDQTIEHRRLWFGWGLTRRYEFDELERIDLKKRIATDNQDKMKAPMTESSTWFSGSPFELMLVDPNNSVVCSLHGLTEGEARWIGDIILRERPFWFR